MVWSLFCAVTLMQPGPGAWTALALALALLLASALASGSEIAFFSLSPNDISQLDPEHDSRDADIMALRQDQQRTLATILIRTTW
jgi:CBS domain containing-hemolysin-like protein